MKFDGRWLTSIQITPGLTSDPFRGARKTRIKREVGQNEHNELHIHQSKNVRSTHPLTPPGKGAGKRA